MDERKRSVVEMFGAAAETYGRTGPGCFWPSGRRLVEFAGVRPGERVLDVACGTGAVAVPARDTGAEVTAIDLAPEMVERCRAEGIDAPVMDAETLTVDDASFDVALCGFAVFFWPDHARALGELHRVLRPGGRLAFTSTDELDPRRQWREQLRAAPPTHSPFSHRDGIERIVHDRIGLTIYARRALSRKLGP
jgi:ubiquinone/menaquinone biosynthesis C-methylase UbiE